MRKLTCEQVCSLLTFYIEKCLTDNLMREVEYHLNICKNCKSKYLETLNLYKNYNNVRQNIKKTENLAGDAFSNNQYMIFMENLSAYIDNELNEQDNIRIKKISIINQKARIELENMLYFRYMLQSAFDVTRNNLKKDYSADVISSLFNVKKNSKVQNVYKYFIFFFLAVYSIFFIMSLCN